MSRRTKVVLCLFLISVIIVEKCATAEAEDKKSLLPGRENCGRQTTTGDADPGRSATIGEYPWLALMKYQDAEGKDAGFRCLATLIDSRTVLTSGGCANPTEVTLTGVRLGEHDLTTDPDCKDKDKKECSDSFKDFGVEHKIVHENYTRETGDNDIAIIRLDKDVTFSDSIRPICLPLNGSTSGKPGDNATTSGWGRSIITNALITTKKIVLSTVISKEDCAKEYAKIKKEITDNHICTRAFRNNTEFTCAGDSGGPLMYFFEDVWELIGIVSNGLGCGYTNPYGNIKVANYLDWIESNIRPWNTTEKTD